MPFSTPLVGLDAIAESNDGFVVARRCRESGTWISVFDAAVPGSAFDYDEARWWTLCGAHDAIASHATRAEATRAAAHPFAWCEHCADIPEHLSADGMLRVPSGEVEAVS